jgi:hypothetical protein
MKTEVRCAGGRGRQYSLVTVPWISMTRLQVTKGGLEKKMASARWKNEERSGGGELITRRAVILAFSRGRPRLLPTRAEPVFLAAIARAWSSRAWLRGNGGFGCFPRCRGGLQLRSLARRGCRQPINPSLHPVGLVGPKNAIASLMMLSGVHR